MQKFDIKTNTLNKLYEVSKTKSDLLNSDEIWFDKPIGEFLYILVGTSFNWLFRQDGSKVYPRGINGKDLITAISSIKNNEIFSYNEIDGRKIKVRMKK